MRKTSLHVQQDCTCTAGSHSCRPWDQPKEKTRGRSVGGAQGTAPAQLENRRGDSPRPPVGESWEVSSFPSGTASGVGASLATRGTRALALPRYKWESFTTKVRPRFFFWTKTRHQQFSAAHFFALSALQVAEMKKQTRAPQNAKYFMRWTNAALPAVLTVPAKIPILPASLQHEVCTRHIQHLNFDLIFTYLKDKSFKIKLNELRLTSNQVPEFRVSC